jgi:isochorismate pyruvate lyase
MVTPTSTNTAPLPEPDPLAPASYRFTDPAYQPLAHTLGELRDRIDALDDQIVALLAQRAALAMDAARFKRHQDEVQARARQAQVQARVRMLAQQHNPGVPGFEDVVNQTYQALVGGLVAAQARVHSSLLPVRAPTPSA